MPFLNTIKKILSYYKPLSTYIVVVLLLFIFLFIFKKPLQYLAFQLHVIPSYYNILVIVSKEIFQWMGFEVTANKPGILTALTPCGDYIIHNKLMALRYALIFFIAGLMLPSKVQKKTFLIITSLTVLQVINIARIITISIITTSSEKHYLKVTREIFDLLLNFSLLTFFYYWFKNNFALKRLLVGKLNVSKKSVKAFLFTLLLSILVFSSVNFLLKTNTLYIASYMSSGILNGAGILLSIMGYPAKVNDAMCLLYGTSCNLHLSFQCLGINLMFVFAVFIVFTKGSLLKKSAFIATGISVIYFLNILRFTFLYIFITKNNGNDAAIMDTHDLYSYVIYVLTFCSWVIWLKFFSNGDNKTD